MKINVIILALLAYVVSFNSLLSFDKLFIQNNTDSNAQLKVSFKESNCASFIVLRSNQALQLNDKILHQIQDIKLSTYGTVKGLLGSEYDVTDSKKLSNYLDKPGCSFIALDSKLGWKGLSWVVSDLKPCSGQEDSLLDSLTNYYRDLSQQAINLNRIKLDDIRKLFNLSTEYNVLDFIPILFHPYSAFSLRNVIRNSQVPKISDSEDFKKAIFSYLLLRLYENKPFKNIELDKLQKCVNKARTARLNAAGLKHYTGNPESLNDSINMYKNAINEYIFSGSDDQTILREDEIDNNDNSWEIIDIQS